MHPFQSFYYLNQDGHIPEPSLVNMMDGGESILSSASKTEAKISTESSCKSHKETERRRRQRINAHLSTLRTLLPNPTKVILHTYIHIHAHIYMYVCICIKSSF
jgi:hypothetical protein